MQDGLIYVEQISERLKYLEFTFFESRGISIQFTNDLKLFSDFEGVKLNYSGIPVEDVPMLVPGELLFEETISKQHIGYGDWFGMNVIRFKEVLDPLATLFFILTRYEEYLPSVRDEHDRYLAKNSVQVQGFDIEEQTVERIFLHFLKTYFFEIVEKYEQNLSSTFVPTFDIDNTYAFKLKEGWRTAASKIKDIVKRDSERSLLRKQVLLGESEDPYDSWDEIKEVLAKNPDSKVFWLLGDFKKYDKNISWNDPRHQRLIREIEQFARVGLHPSYASNTEIDRLGIEKLRLEQILNKKVCHSRQHFLKVKLPVTYQQLLSQEFNADYSMGYAELAGFRAGTAHQHYWFDLSQNIRTNLLLQPFCYMDGTLNQYMKLSIEESVLKVKKLIDEVKQFGGGFCFLWHNESFAESGIWKNWRRVYAESEMYWMKKESND